MVIVKALSYFRKSTDGWLVKSAVSYSQRLSSFEGELLTWNCCTMIGYGYAVRRATTNMPVLRY